MSAIEPYHGHPDTRGRQASTEALDLLNRALLFIDDARRHCVEAGDTDALMIGLENLRKFTDQLATVTKAVEGNLTDLIPEGWHRVPHGKGWIEHAKTDPKVAWDSPGLLASVVRNAVDPEGTGEITGSIAEIIWRIQADVLKAAPMTPTTGWKVTGLREIGVAFEQYRTVTQRPGHARWVAQLPPAIAARIARQEEKKSHG